MFVWHGMTGNPTSYVMLGPNRQYILIIINRSKTCNANDCFCVIYSTDNCSTPDLYSGEILSLFHKGTKICDSSKSYKSKKPK